MQQLTHMAVRCISAKATIGNTAAMNVLIFPGHGSYLAL
jgi:hypothetical protein